MATYSEADLANDSVLQTLEMAPEPEPADNRLFCWPWVGVIVNIVGNPSSEGDSSYWTNRFSMYEPVGVEIFSDDRVPAAQGVVKFDSSWAGFLNANGFEKCFEVVGRSKKEWIEQEMSPGPGIYCWIARENDYNSEGPLGDYLRQNGELKTISNIMEEQTNAMKTLAGNLSNTIDQENAEYDLEQLQIEYNENSMSSSRML